MKYKKPKYSSYKKLNKGMSHGTGSSKRWWIIGGIIAAVVLIAAIIAIVVLTNSQKQSEIDKTEQVKNEVQEIQIARKPDRLTYYCGMQFDPTGLSVYSLTNGGEFTKLSLDECTITGFDSSVAVKEQVITVTYKGFTDTFTIEIKEEPTGTPVLESISMQTLPKTEYKVKEGLNSDGGVILCTYSDGSTKTVDLINEYVYGFRAAYLAGVGTYDITVKYNEDGVTAETTYKITITK